MSRSERKQFFERLVELRDAYRAESHEALDLTLADAMVLAQRMVAAEAGGGGTAGVPRATDAGRDA